MLITGGISASCVTLRMNDRAVISFPSLPLLLLETVVRASAHLSPPQHPHLAPSPELLSESVAASPGCTSSSGRDPRPGTVTTEGEITL